MSILQTIETKISIYASEFERNLQDIHLLAVTKNQPTPKIEMLLQEGHRLFGENRVQEAYSKWPSLKKLYPRIEIHLIGHLQRNKVSEAITLFDTIQTLDSFKLADKLSAEQEKQNKYLKYYIEVNIGKEPQKAGIWPEEFENFLERIRACYPLNIQGIMCIPPSGKDPAPYFKLMKELAAHHHLPVISMGMSQDYKLAIQYGSTMLRIGSALFNQ